MARGDGVDAAGAVDPGEAPASLVVGNDGGRLLAVGGESRAHGLAVVVRPAGEVRAAAVVADALDGRPVEAVVIAGAAVGAGEAADDALDQRLLVDLDGDHAVEHEAALGQHLVQCRRLRHRAREAVQDEAAGAVRPVDPLGDERHHQVVRHQLAGLHDRPGPRAERGALLHRRPQHVAGGKLDDAEALDQPLRLCALARARWAEKDQVQRRLPLSFAFLISPSY